MTLPSGEQFEITFGGHRAVIPEVGAGLRTYSVGGVDVVDGYRADEMCSAGRGQQLIPWPNRIQDGIYEFAGRTHRLPLNEPDRQNAIHGLVRWAPWIATEHASSVVVMEHVLHPSPGYPFTLRLSIRYELSERGLSVATTATNAGTSACPYGIGFHPYLTVGEPHVDTVKLQIPARSVLCNDGRGIPIAPRDLTATEFDFRRARPIGATKLDHAYTDLSRDADGYVRVVMTAISVERELELWADVTCTHVMVFTGDTIPNIARRSLAIEPMTCAPNAFRTGQDVRSLEPGQSTVSVWGIRPSAPV